jgi:hypothetical protein
MYYALALVLFAALSSSASTFAWSPDRDRADWPLTSLGRRCSELDADAPTDLRWFCANDRVVGVGMPIDAFHVDLAGARQHIDRGYSVDQAPTRGHRLRVDERDGVVFARKITCEGCRRPMGVAFVFWRASIAAEDLARIQGEIGLAPQAIEHDREWAAALHVMD